MLKTAFEPTQMAESAGWLVDNVGSISSLAMETMCSNFLSNIENADNLVGLFKTDTVSKWIFENFQPGKH
jgi:hypothetical protein